MFIPFMPDVIGPELRMSIAAIAYVSSVVFHCLVAIYVEHL